MKLSNPGLSNSRGVGILLKRLAESAASFSGRQIAIDDNLSSPELARELVDRLAMLLRGALRFRQFVFVGRGVKVRGRHRLRFGRAVSIGPGCSLDARGTEGLTLGDTSRLGRGGIITMTSRLSKVGVGMRLGARSGIGDFFHIGCSGGVDIGRNVIVGPFLTIHSQSHRFEDFDKPIRDQGTIEERVSIADDSWIGARVTFLAGSSIGPRTVVAAGSVIRGKHPGGEILAGIPAKRIRSI